MAGSGLRAGAYSALLWRAVRAGATSHDAYWVTLGYLSLKAAGVNGRQTNTPSLIPLFTQTSAEGTGIDDENLYLCRHDYAGGFISAAADSA